MNFHHQVHVEEENASYLSIRQLQLWLLTIAPTSNSLVTEKVLNSLDALVEELGYETEYDTVLGRNILPCQLKFKKR